MRRHYNNCGAFGYVDDPSPDELNQVYDMARQVSEYTDTYAVDSTDERIARSLLDAEDCPSLKYNCLDYGGDKGSFAKVLI